MEEKGEIALPWEGSSWAGERDGVAGRARVAVTLSDTPTCCSSRGERLLKWELGGHKKKARLNMPHSHLSLSKVTRAEVGYRDQSLLLQAGALAGGKNGWLFQRQL